MVLAAWLSDLKVPSALRFGSEEAIVGDLFGFEVWYSLSGCDVVSCAGGIKGQEAKVSYQQCLPSCISSLARMACSMLSLSPRVHNITLSTKLSADLQTCFQRRVQLEELSEVINNN